MEPQAGILEACTPVGRHLTFDLRAGADPRAALDRLISSASPSTVIGIGLPLVRALGANVEGLRAFPALAGCGVSTPSTQNAIWTFVREPSASDCFDTSRKLEAALGADFTTVDDVGAFVYRGGHDLSGYEDGTENPQGDHARRVGVVGGGPLEGSSFAAVQRWVHDFPRFRALSGSQRDSIIGRALESNDEIPDAPVSAHVRRSAQESFEPDAFMVRRSMPWSERGEHGLYFLAFGESLDRFERVMCRMLGMDDGVVDGLFAFTRPLTGGYYWCPPQSGGRLNLAALGI